MVLRPERKSAPKIEIFRDVDVPALRRPDLESVVGEDAWWLPYRDYGPTWGATFEDAIDCLDWERSFLARLPERTKEAEDELFDNLEEIDEPYQNWGLDIGVGSAALALSAAGCATLVSCSGHFGEGQWIQFPMVQFAADEARVEILLEAAESAECGMINSAEGLVEVWAASIDNMLAFADAVLSERDRLEQLPPAIVRSTEKTTQEVRVEVHPGQQQLFEDDEIRP